MNPWVRSVFAVVCGYVAMAVIVSLATMIALRSMGLSVTSAGAQTSAPYLAMTLTYSFAAAAVAGYLAAMIAGRAPLQHGLALALLILMMSGMNAAQAWGTQPAGYVLALSLLAPLFCMAGAWRRSKQM